MSFKQFNTVPFATIVNVAGIKNWCPVWQYLWQGKEHCLMQWLMVMSAEHRFKFWALHRQWWFLYISSIIIFKIAIITMMYLILINNLNLSLCLESLLDFRDINWKIEIDNNDWIFTWVRQTINKSTDEYKENEFTSK